MTRGYACLIDGKEVKKVAYLQGDAYVRGYGLKILKAVCDDKLEDWFDKQVHYNHECYGNNEPDPNFSLNWIRKSPETKGWLPYDFCEYGYVYNVRTGELKIYHYGSLLCVVKKEERDKFLFAFEHDSEIESGYFYNAESMSYNFKNWERRFRKLVEESSVAELQGYVDACKVPRPILGDSHLVLPGYSDNHPVYGKPFHVDGEVEEHGEVMFICEKQAWSSKWDVLIQLPCVRAYIAHDFASEKKAVDYIRIYIRKVGTDKLVRFAQISDMYKEAVKGGYNKTRDFSEQLQQEWDKESWVAPGGGFTVRDIQYNLSKY